MYIYIGFQKKITVPLLALDTHNISMTLVLYYRLSPNLSSCSIETNSEKSVNSKRYVCTVYQGHLLKTDISICINTQKIVLKMIYN